MEIKMDNPYDGDPKNRHRWNVGFEDGSRGEPRRGKSEAYNEGWDAGIVLFRQQAQLLGFRQVPTYKKPEVA
jgi:hypothetical protein